MRKTIITRSERVDWKRCPKKWYWKWRKGYVPRAMSFGPLDLGEWVHNAFGSWYKLGLERSSVPLSHLVRDAGETALGKAQEAGAPDHVLQEAEELIELSMAMMHAYQRHYKDDSDVEVIAVETPLEFTIGQGVSHLLKPDLVYRSRSTRFVWLMEHKTAAQIRTEHLLIDDQARPYGAMAEPALRRMGVLKKSDRFRGIMYNFSRKVLPDERPRNAQGQALNKNGSVSARQPAIAFLRKPLTMTNQAKRITLDRVRMESILIDGVAKKVRAGKIVERAIPITPHHSCPKFCDYFAICVAQEEGTDTTDMERASFTRVNPYEYYGETTSEAVSFEMG